MRDIFVTIAVPDKAWQDNENKYVGFKRARAWANFSKHPGFFAYGLHHPIYLVEGSSAAAEARAAAAKATKTCQWALIDTEFVRDHWTDTTGSKAKKALAGKVTAAVLLPEPAIFTEDLSTEYEQFTQQICRNPDYVELLRTVSTARNVPCFWDEFENRNQQD